MTIDFRRWPWLLLLIACLAGGLYSWFYFPSAFPILDVDISMDRTRALEKAQERARRLDLGPENFRSSARFHQDREVQTFVELEAGGKDAFRAMMRQDHYQAFQWHVRLYEPGETREVQVRFAPDGRIYGFHEKWAEDDTGPALSSEKARSMAESDAREHWNVDLSNYELISSGQEEAPSGRVDHTFTYEHTERSIGDGDYRLRLAVSGNQLSEVTRYVRVPEGFTRRYQNMRSANSVIQNVGNIFVYVIYLLVGCLFGAYWLLKRDALRWKTPLLWGGFITVLLVLVELNRLPLAWMNYDTALSPGNFLAQQIVGALTSTLPFGLFITLSFVAGEGLTRVAFGHHPKLWRSWNPEAAGSKTIRDLTIFGYVFLGLYFAYNVALYGFAYEYLGWWSPSNLLYNPNVLSHYFPWLQPVVNSLRAGFWEEVLFRAVPLAGAALIGRRYGQRRWWIGGALVLQALVFGAGHASYATQPSYARVVELFFSSIGLGVIYLAYGLLPAVIIHFLYDLVLMSMPIFVSTAPGIWISQSMVVLAGAVPLLVVIYGWYYKGFWADLPEKFFNRSWTPSEEGRADYTLPVRPGLSGRRVGAVLLAGLVGLGLWLSFGTFESVEVPLELTRNDAESRAQTLLREKGENPDDWMTVSQVSSPRSQSDAFVWQETGRDTYASLMGTYLPGPRWSVRFVTFEGSVAERAEEYRVNLAPGYGLAEINHRLPESAEGDRLSEERARAQADSAVRDAYGYDPSEIEFLGASPQSRPNRRDWTITYRGPEKYDLGDGETRVEVSLLGSEVTDTTRYVHVPEEWERERRGQQQLLGLVTQSGTTLVYLVVLAGALAGVFFWGTGRKFSLRAALVVFTALVILLVVGTLNDWPLTMANLDTAEPYMNQVMMALLGQLPRLLSAGILSLVAGFAHAQIGTNRTNNLMRSILAGVGLGLFGTGLLAVAGYLAPDLQPPWGNYGTLSRALPFFHPMLQSLRTVLYGTLILLLFGSVEHRLTRGGQRFGVWTFLGIVGFGFLVGSLLPVNHLLGWLYVSVGLALVFVGSSLWVLPFDRSLIPVAVGTFVVLNRIQEYWITDHPYTIAGAVLAVVFTVSVAGAWTYGLLKFQEQS